MKKCILFTLFIFFSLYLSAQESETSNFSVAGRFGLGNSNINTQNYKNLAGSAGSFQLDVNYDLPIENNVFSYLRFGLGFQLNSSNANLFFGSSQASLIAETFRVPVYLNGVIRLGRDEASLLSDTKLVAGFGGFLNHVYKYEVTDVENSADIEKPDTGFGVIVNLGLEQDVSEHFAAFVTLDYSLMGDENKVDEVNINTTTFNLGVRYRL